MIEESRFCQLFQLFARNVFGSILILPDQLLDVFDLGGRRVTKMEGEAQTFLGLYQLDEESDINLVRDFFSYNHFYVIWCGAAAAAAAALARVSRAHTARVACMRARARAHRAPHARAHAAPAGAPPPLSVQGPGRCSAALRGGQAPPPPLAGQVPLLGARRG